MRKLFFFSVVFAALFFAFVSVGVKKASAQILGSSAIVSGYLDNTTGTIPITVTISFYSGSAGSTFLLPAPNPKVYVVPVGQRVSASYTDTIDRGWYQISWGTSCTDPPVSTSNAVVPGAYIFASQDVHCTTPNATPSISNTACANFGWNLTGVGSNGANISSFEVFMSTNSSQIGPGDPTIGPSGTRPSSARSYDFGALSPGTYYVRVRAVSPQAVGSWSSVNQFTCAPAGLAPVAASGLSASRSCNGSGVITANIVNVAFTWNRSTPMPSDEQWIDYSVFNNNFGGGYANASLGTSASSYNGTGFAQGIRYYWRINNRYGTNWYPSATGSFVTPTCPPGSVGGPTPPPASPPPPIPGTSTITGVADCSLGGVRLDWTVTGLPIPQGPNFTTGITYTSTGLSGFTAQADPQYYYPAQVYKNRIIIPFGTNTAGTIVSPAGYGSMRVDRTINNSFGQTYTYYAFNYYVFENPPGSGSWELGTTMSSGITITNPASCAPPVTYTITASGNSDCIDGTNAKVHLTWTSDTDNTTYTIYKDGVAQSPTVGGAGRSWDSGPEPSGQTHSWVVRGTGGVAGTVNSNAVSVTTAACEPPPANPAQLSISISCNGLNPEVLFRFTDMSTNEDGFWLDINTKAWTGPTAPSPWGVKTITSTPAQKAAVGLPKRTYTWSASAPLDVGGDVDGVAPGAQLTPAKSTEYYWRVKAFNASRQSEHVYPASGTVAPGSSFKTLSCTPNYDLSARITSFSKQIFDVGETATFTVEVENSQYSTAASAPTQLYFFPDGTTRPVCKNLPDGTLDPTSSPVTTVPKDATGIANQSYAVPSIPVADPLVPGSGTWTGTVQFKVSNTPTNLTGYAYVVPSCSFAPDPGIDPNFTNNLSPFGYIVGSDGFFETQKGDVGAVGDVSVEVESSGLGLYQSDYVIAAHDIEDEVASKKGWMLNNYNKKFVPSGGLYELFDKKFKSGSGVTSTCSFTLSTAINYCSGNLTFNASDSAPIGDHVYFVEGNLRIKKNFELNAASTMVFLVNGDVTVDLRVGGTGPFVNRVDGIYIVKGVFYDSDVADAGIATPADALTLNGALYAENPGSGLNLKRYFTGPYNATNAPNRFIWDPKYIVQLTNLIGIKSIQWREVAP